MPEPVTDSTPSGDDLHPLLQRLALALAAGKLARTRQILTRIASSPPFMERHRADVEGLLRQHGQTAMLEDILSEAAGEETLTGQPAASAAPAPERSAAAPAPFMALVQRKARELDLDSQLVDRLFPYRQQQDMTLEEWMEGFRFAAALEALTDDGTFPSRDMAAMFHPATADTMARLTEDGKARLYVIGHVGFTAARNHFIRAYLKNSIPFRRQLDKPPYVWAKDDGRTALFSCLRALTAGTSVILAADGPVGDIRAPIKVIGCDTSMATGGVFLAHESKVEVVWLNIVHDNGTFAVELEKAPEPLPRERLKDYQVRFVAFYESMLNRYFTGAPSNIVMRNRWRRRSSASHPGTRIEVPARSAEDAHARVSRVTAAGA